MGVQQTGDVMRIAIIGAGLAGLACAARLTGAGRQVSLFDKGRGPGGRMSSRRVATALGEAGFDHGAQYFTARDAGFHAQVEQWHREGLVAPWPAAGPDCWVGTPAMNAPLEQLAASLPIRWNTRVESLSGSPGSWTLHGPGRGNAETDGDVLQEGRFDAVLLAVPSENAAPLLGGLAPDLAAIAEATPARPCWTVMAAFADRLPADSDVLKQDDGPTAWIARNSSKPGRAGPEAWIIQAGPAWSREHLEQSPDEIVPLLLAALASRVGAALPTLLTASAHRWRYARSGNAQKTASWDSVLGLGLCGDWLMGPRVECAWVSGVQLAAAVTGQVGQAA